MAIIISHFSAYEIWVHTRRARTKITIQGETESITIAKRTRRVSLPTKEMLKNIEPEIIASSLGLSLPIHLAVRSANDRLKRKFCSFHVWDGRLPRAPFIELTRNLFVVSPEICFIQISHQADRARLIRAGYELCSIYCYQKQRANQEDESKPAINRRDPITSKSRLTRTINQASGAKGAKQARSALSYILDNSASPRETALSMILTLPYYLGGYSLPLPELNKRIELGMKAKESLNKSFLACDFVWVNHKVLVEYDSDSFHTGADRIADDSKRRNELVSQGFSIVTITTKQLNDIDETHHQAMLLSRKLKKRVKPSRSDFYARRMQLRRITMSNEPAYVNKDGHRVPRNT